MVTNTSIINTLENHEQITLKNKMADVFPLQNYLVNKLISVNCMHAFLLCSLPYKAANDGIVMEKQCHITGICEAEAAILLFS